jgi:hypothetical protein
VGQVTGLSTLYMEIVALDEDNGVCVSLCVCVCVCVYVCGRKSDLRIH